MPEHCKHLQYSFLRTIALTSLCAVFCISCFSTALAVENATYHRQILMVVGFDGTSWHPYILSLPRTDVIKRDHWQKIEAIVDPFSVTRRPGTGDFFVKDNRGLLQRFTKTGQHHSSLPGMSQQGETANYTQLRAYDDGLVMVQLLQGKSRDTQLIRYREEKENGMAQSIPYEPLIQQVSGQFQPLIGRDGQTERKALYYGNVSCRLACNPVIQEIWKQDLLTGRAEQLTLLNATSYLHSVDDSGRFGFISSNQHGNYHLARLDLENKELTWLTDGRATDSYPCIATTGDLYFIRRTSQGTHLMRLSDSTNRTGPADTHSLTTIALPEGVQKIRYLELSAQ